MNTNKKTKHKVVYLDQVLGARRKEDSLLVILRDSQRVAEAIKHRTCILCKKMKMCVNKTGLCASCYLNLLPHQKKVADEEARHKRVEIKVTDDRWKREDDE
jgi:hypothetical protein